VQFHQVSLLLCAKAWRSVSPALILNKLVDVFFTKLPQAFSLCRLQAHEITSGRIDCAGEDPPDPRVARFGVAPLPPGFSQRVGQRLRSYVSMPQCRARPARANSTKKDRSVRIFYNPGLSLSSGWHIPLVVPSTFFPIYTLEGDRS